jgi:hypothetical protein
MKTSMKPLKGLLTATLVISGAQVGAAEVPINLNTWSQRGPVSHGNWVVAPDGSSVLQTINGNPTFFVSPGNQFNTTLRGKISVQTTGDDDYIGFVFGFNGPAANGTDMDFLLFDWKQTNQGAASEGFGLARVQGNVPTAQSDPVFWNRVDNPAFGYDNLATRFGPNEGWQDNVEYDFTMLYQQNRIKIDIAGGAFGGGQTIFDLAGVFNDGRFGFYNYSQASVRYAGLTEEATPPPPGGSNPVPAPGTALLAALGLGALAVQRRGR